MSDVTRILSAIEGGDQHAAEQLLPLIYAELRRLAAQRMAQEAPDHTLQATALVHEAYVRLVDVDDVKHWDSRGHFFAAAAEAMRRILVESARRKVRHRHGGNRRRVELDEACSLVDDQVGDLLDLNDALERLASEDPFKAEVVKLRFFAGLSIPETADLLRCSHATVERHWSYAKLWLYCALDEADNPSKS